MEFEAIIEFIQQNGLAAFAFIGLFYLYRREQDIAKQRMELDAESSKAETGQQDRLIALLGSFQVATVGLDTSVKSLTDTVKTAFDLVHRDTAKVESAMDAQASGLIQLSEKIVSFESAMNEHTEKKPDIIAELQKINASLQEVNTRLDRIENDTLGEIKTIKTEVGAIQTKVKEVEKRVTQETPKVDTLPLQPSKAVQVVEEVKSEVKTIEVKKEKKQDE